MPRVSLMRRAFRSNEYAQERSRISQLHCTKERISNPKIVQTAKNSKHCQREKFLVRFCSFQKQQTITRTTRKTAIEKDSISEMS